MPAILARLAGPALRALMAAAFVATAAGGIALLHAAREPATADRAAARPLPVVLVPAERQNGHTVEHRFAGRLEPARQTALAFDSGGIVATIAVEEGDRIAAGAVVARLDTDRLSAERRRLAARQAAVAAELELARRTLERQDVLERQGHASTQRLDEARLAVAALTARRAEVVAAIATVDVALDKAVLRAPFAGTVGARHRDDGAVVDAGMPVVDLLESGRREARIGVSPRMTETLAAGDAVTLRAGDRTLAATVRALRPDLATGTRTATVLLSIEAGGGGVLGDVVELILSRGVATPGFWLPMTALVEGERGLWTVYTARPAGDDGGLVVGREAVEIRHVDGDRVYVDGTLANGATVIADGAHRVIPGQRVTAAPGPAPETVPRRGVDLVEARP